MVAGRGPYHHKTKRYRFVPLLMRAAALNQGGLAAVAPTRTCGREDVTTAMGSVSTTSNRFKKGSPGRAGRPPRELAGEVEVRILDAARRVFLERGLAGASIDEIAELASAGKPTIYARFPSKEALFSAVVMRKVAANVAGFANFVPAGATIEERLASVGATVLHRIL